MVVISHHSQDSELHLRVKWSLSLPNLDSTVDMMLSSIHPVKTKDSNLLPDSQRLASLFAQYKLFPTVSTHGKLEGVCEEIDLADLAAHFAYRVFANHFDTAPCRWHHATSSTSFFSHFFDPSARLRFEG